MPLFSARSELNGPFPDACSPIDGGSFVGCVKRKDPFLHKFSTPFRSKQVRYGKPNRNEAGFTASFYDRGLPSIPVTQIGGGRGLYFNGADNEIHSPSISQTVLGIAPTQGGRLTQLTWQRQVMSIILVVSFSCASLGAESSTKAGAVLRASGDVEVNGAVTRDITTLFPGDLVKTNEDSVANIIAGGSSVLVMPNASVKFTGHDVEVSEGGVSVATSEGMAVIASGLTITPAAQKASKFEVADNEDSVAIAAREGNLTVDDGQQTSTVPEGQESTHNKKKKGGAAPAAGGSHAISGKTWAIVGGASAATVTGILIAESDKKKKCVSSAKDKKCKCTKDKRGNEDCEE